MESITELCLTRPTSDSRSSTSASRARSIVSLLEEPLAGVSSSLLDLSAGYLLPEMLVATVKPLATSSFAIPIPISPMDNSPILGRDPTVADIL